MNSPTISVSWHAVGSDTTKVHVFAAEFNHDFKQVSSIGGNSDGGSCELVGSGLDKTGTAHLAPGDTTCFIAVSIDAVGNTAVTGNTSKTNECVTRVRGIKGFLASTVSENDTGNASGWLYPFGHPHAFHYADFTATSKSDSGEDWSAGGRVTVGEAYWFDGAHKDSKPNAPNANDPVWLAPVFDSPWYAKSVTIDLTAATTRRHALIPIPQLSVRDISNGVPCSRHDCGKGDVSNFPSYAGFVPNLYLEIQALSGKPEIENAASRPATDFMLSGFSMPTTS